MWGGGGGGEVSEPIRSAELATRVGAVLDFMVYSSIL